MTLQSRTAVAALIAILLAAPSASADTIALWTFEPGAPTQPGSSATVNGSTATTSTGRGSPTALSASAWDVGDNFQFTLSTAGFRNIAVSWDQMSSNTGPGDFQLQYSTDGTTFTRLDDYTVLNAGWTGASTDTTIRGGHYSSSFASVPALNDAATLYLRLTDTSTRSATNGTVSSAGTSRVDNFTITGDPVPLPAAATAGTLLLGALTTRRRTR